MRFMSNNKAIRHNKGKPKWSLVHYGSMVPMIRALEHGLREYGKDNWKKGLDPTEILESIQRHLASIMDGELVDPSTGVSHMGHIQANAMFYNYFTSNSRDIDIDISSGRESEVGRDIKQYE